MTQHNLTANEIEQMTDEQIWERTEVAFRNVRRWARKVRHYEDVLTRATSAVDKNSFNNKRVSAVERLQDAQCQLAFYSRHVRYFGARMDSGKLAVKLAHIV